MYDDENKPTSSEKAQSDPVPVKVEVWKVGENMRIFVFHIPAPNTGVRQGFSE